MVTSLFAVIGVMISAAIGSVGSLFFKRASKHLKFDVVSLITNWDLILGFGSFGVSVVIFLASLRHGELSVLYPLASTSYIWTLLLSHYLLGERLNKYKWLGICIIILGVGFIGLGS